MRSDVIKVVAATTDERAAAQQRHAADGEESRRDEGLEEALGNPRKGDRDDGIPALRALLGARWGGRPTFLNGGRPPQTFYCGFF